MNIKKLLCWLGWHDWVTVIRGSFCSSDAFYVDTCSRCYEAKWQLFAKTDAPAKYVGKIQESR